MVSSKKIICDAFEIEIISNDYYKLFITGKEEFVLDDLKKMVHSQEVLGAFKLPVLIVCDKYANTNVDVMKHISDGLNTPYSVADAFVINSLAQKILANFYLKIHQPNKPTKFFNNSKDALLWLNQFI